MDNSKLLCPTLSVVLVKTIKALCEINIKYDSKLEITGSLHVRSDGQKVLTCLLDEESVKGQHDAARIAELATRLSMAAATFPFAHLQIPVTVNHPNHHHNPPQLGTELYLSSSGGDVHLVNANVQQSSVAMQVERVTAVRDEGGQQLQAVIPQQLAVGLGANAQLTTAVYHHHLHLKQPDSAVQMLVQESNEEIRINQSTVRPSFENFVAKLPINLQQNQQQSQASQNIQQQPQIQFTHLNKKSKQLHLQQQQQIQQLQQSQSSDKLTLSLKGSPPTFECNNSNTNNNLSNQLIIATPNHIKLPDIQTLAHSLPKYPNQKLKGEVVASLIDSSGNQIAAVDLQSNKCIENLSNTSYAYIPQQQLQQQQIQQQQQFIQQQIQLQQQQQEQQSHESTPTSILENPPAIEVMIKDNSTIDTNNTDNTPTTTSTPVSGAGADVQNSRRKKFQCMFCGIFLSTKCYLKNHVNAVHTRARVYPCELCERFFYSAGALRIHKLRNHWQGAKKHVCSQCGETFLLPIELRKHLLKKHFLVVEAGQNDDHNTTTNTNNTLVTTNNNTNSLSQQFKIEDSDIPMPQLHPENLEAALLTDTLSDTPTSVCYSAPDLRSSPQQLSSDPPSLVDDAQLA